MYKIFFHPESKTTSKRLITQFNLKRLSYLKNKKKDFAKHKNKQY